MQGYYKVKTRGCEPATSGLELHHPGRLDRIVLVYLIGLRMLRDEQKETER